MILVLVIGLGAVAVTVSRYLTAHMFTTLTTALIPIGATTIGIIALGETLLPQEIIGGCIMIGAALLVSYFGSKERVK